jgi:hypothetical protein
MGCEIFETGGFPHEIGRRRPPQSERDIAFRRRSIERNPAGIAPATQLEQAGLARFSPQLLFLLEKAPLRYRAGNGA